MDREREPSEGSLQRADDARPLVGRAYLLRGRNNN